MKRCPACGSEYPDDASFCTHDRTALMQSDGEGGTEQIGDLDPLVGHTLADRYRIIDLLGAGGMGRVYLAEQIPMKRRCAIKLLPKALSADPAAVTRRFPSDLEQVVSRALARWPRERYATAEEFGRAVREVAGRGVPHLAELPTVAADATRVALPDAVPRTEVAPERHGGQRRVRARAPLIVATVGVVAIAAATGYALRGRTTEADPGMPGGPSQTARVDAILASGPLQAEDSSIDRAGGARAPEGKRPSGAAARQEGREGGAVAATNGVLGDTGEAPALVVSSNVESINVTLLALQDRMFDVPEGRSSYRRRASRIFEQRMLPDSLRIRAALTVAWGYITDSAFHEAQEWSVRAYDLIPESDNEWRSRVKAPIDRLAEARD